MAAAFRAARAVAFLSSRRNADAALRRPTRDPIDLPGATYRDIRLGSTLPTPNVGPHRPVRTTVTCVLKMTLAQFAEVRAGGVAVKATAIGLSSFQPVLLALCSPQ